MSRLRIALFGSYYRGLAMLETLLSLQQHYPEIVVCGVATDDPSKLWTSPNARVWQYPYTSDEEFMVCRLAERYGIRAWRGRIQDAAFRELYIQEWKPDVCYMGTFGQKVPPNIFDYPPHGFYNLHPCVDRAWPSYVGGNPFRAMLKNGEQHGVIALHHVDSDWDHGRLVAFSQRYSINPWADPEEGKADFRGRSLEQLGARIRELHRISSREAAPLMKWHIGAVSGRYQSDYRPQIPSANEKAKVLAGGHPMRVSLHTKPPLALELQPPRNPGV